MNREGSFTEDQCILFDKIIVLEQFIYGRSINVVRQDYRLVYDLYPMGICEVNDQDQRYTTFIADLHFP